MYCKECGKELATNAKFCQECGTPVYKSNDFDMKQNIEQRKIVFDGKIHKCPACGEQIKSFITNCPTCGHELRETNVSNAIKELELKLENTTSLQERSDIIRNFYIPNTKEDIFEFIIMAASNMDSDAKEMTAWVAKMKQAYEKAKVSFKDTNDFIKIEKIYSKTTAKYYKKKIINGNKEFWIFAILILLCYLMLFSPFSFFAKEEQEHKEHIVYLETLVEEVEKLIENGEYDTARIKASKIVDDTGWSTESEEKWEDIKRTLEDAIDKKEKESKKK